jgi:hypothetical protein
VAHLYHALCCTRPKGLPPPTVTGRTVAAIRTMFGLAAEDVARSAGLTPYSLSRLERCHRLPVAGEVASLMSAIGQLADTPQTSGSP